MRACMHGGVCACMHACVHVYMNFRMVHGFVLM